LTDSEFWRSIAEKFRSIFDVPNGMPVRKLLSSDSPDSFSVWMLKMRKTRPNQHVETRTFESGDGTRHITEICLILDVLQASANLCDEMELEAQLEEQGRRCSAAFVERFKPMRWTERP